MNRHIPRALALLAFAGAGFAAQPEPAELNPAVDTSAATRAPNSPIIPALPRDAAPRAHPNTAPVWRNW